MKKTITILSFLFFASVISLSAQGITKVFFDRDMQKIDYEEFASFYRLELPSNNGNITYRFFSQEGKLLAEGKAVSFDYQDDSRNVYIGENLFYYDNGKIQERLFFHNAGTVNDDYEYESYNESGQTLYKGLVKSGKFTGEVFSYENNTLITHMSIKDGNLDGEVTTYYPNGTVKSSTMLREGKRSGPFVTYHASGEIESKGFYENDLLNGSYTEYSNQGIPSVTYSKKNGIVVGDIVYHNMKKKSSIKSHEMVREEDSPIFAAIMPMKYECSVERGLTTPEKIAKTYSNENVSYSGSHYNLIRFDLYMSNVLSEPIQFKIENIAVRDIIKQKRVSDENYAIPIEESIRIYESHFRKESYDAYEKAGRTAKNVATSTTITAENSNSFGEVNTATVGVSGSAGAASSTVVGNNGYAIGTSAGAGVGASAVAQTKSSWNRNSTFSVSTTIDNAVYYSVLETERRKADLFTKGLEISTEQEMRILDTNDILIEGKDNTHVVILATEVLGGGEKSYKIEFTINGIKFSCEVPDSQIPNYYETVDPLQ